MRKSWQDLKDRENLEFKYLGRPYWGTKGSYVNKNAVFALVEEMGSGYESLMEAAMDTGEEAADEDAALGAMMTADYQLRQTRLIDEDEQDFWNEYDSQNEDDDESVE